MLGDYLSGKMKIVMNAASNTPNEYLGKLDANFDREIRRCEARMQKHEDFLFGIQLSYEQTSEEEFFSVP